MVVETASFTGSFSRTLIELPDTTHNLGIIGEGGGGRMSDRVRWPNKKKESKKTQRGS